MAREGSPQESMVPVSPQLDWVPLSRAYLYYRTDGYLHSVQDWHRYVGEMVEAYAEEEREAFHVRPADQHREINIEALYLVLTISPETGNFALTPKVVHEDEIEDLPLPEGEAANFLEACRRYRGPRHWEFGVDWHSRLVDYLVKQQARYLATAIRSGAAHVWARKRDVLAPFERIMPDQLYHFTPSLAVSGMPNDSGQPTEAVLPPREPLIALKGPADERLFSVYVAPGERFSEQGKAIEQCVQWVRELVAANPDKRPYTKAVFVRIAREKFGNMSERAVLRILGQYQPASWSRPGAPTKSQREIEAQI